MLAVSSSNAAILLVLLLGSLLFHDAAAEWVETAKLTDSDGQASDYFGEAVAIENDILVVGASWDDDIRGAPWAGSATIFELSDSEWVAQQKLTASDARTWDRFGSSVAIANGIVALGAPLEDNDGGTDAGAVYIYEKKGADGAWTESQKLIHGDAAANDWFGRSLAMQGSTLVVGAYGDDSRSGSVYVYTLLAGTSWTQVATLTANDRSAEDQFGHSVAIDVDTILVVARYDDDMGPDSGSAYVFQRDGQGGSWTQVAKLTPSDGQSLDNFGRAVALEGGTVWVGSFNNVDGEGVGAVYQFGEEGRTWTQQSKLVARDLAPNDFFGYGLAFRNGTLVVGAWGQQNKTGAVYVFQQVSDVWTQRAKLVASDGAAGDVFGWSVAVEDGMAFAGAPGDNSNRGSAYAFEWRTSETDVGPSTSQPTRHPSAQAAAPIATQNSDLQPIMVFVIVGIAFLAGGVAVWIVSRRNNGAAVPNRDVPNNDHRVVFTDDISALEEPSVANEIPSVEPSVASKVHTLDAETPTIDHSQETSAAPSIIAATSNRRLYT